jgi:hypothetical protein
MSPDMMNSELKPPQPTNPLFVLQSEKESILRSISRLNRRLAEVDRRIQDIERKGRM